MPPLSFCYHRCYTTDPGSFRRKVNLYFPHDQLVAPEAVALKNQGMAGNSNNGGLTVGTCTFEDVMYYCGGDHGISGGPNVAFGAGKLVNSSLPERAACERCDYEF